MTKSSSSRRLLPWGAGALALTLTAALATPITPSLAGAAPGGARPVLAADGGARSTAVGYGGAVSTVDLDATRTAIGVAERGFTVAQEFHDQTRGNADRFRDIAPTRELFLPGARPPEVGSNFRAPDLAATYRALARHGVGWFYRGRPARDIVETVRRPPVDPAYSDVPTRELLSAGFAKERACLVDPARAAASPVPAGAPDGDHHRCEPTRRPGRATTYEGPQTTNLAVADKHGNVAAYTGTIEQLGGSALTVPGRGFPLNNELTDFSPAPPADGSPDPNLPAGGKRPRSSMSPTLVMRRGRPVLAIGSPGGTTIPTTVLQILLNRLDLGMDLPAAVAAPRATQRNTPVTYAEQPFIDRYGDALKARGHTVQLFLEHGPEGVIGAATGLEPLGGGKVQAVAEPVRRHGGSALVVRPATS